MNDSALKQALGEQLGAKVGLLFLLVAVTEQVHGAEPVLLALDLPGKLLRLPGYVLHLLLGVVELVELPVPHLIGQAL